MDNQTKPVENLTNLISPDLQKRNPLENSQKPEDLLKSYQDKLETQKTNWKPFFADPSLNEKLQEYVSQEIAKRQEEANKIHDKALKGDKNSFSLKSKNKIKEENRQKLEKLVEDAQGKNIVEEITSELRDQYEFIVWVRKRFRQHGNLSEQSQCQADTLVNQLSDDKLHGLFVKALSQDSTTKAEGLKDLKNLNKQCQWLEEEIELKIHGSVNSARNKVRGEIAQVERIFHSYVDRFTPAERRKCFSLEQLATKAFKDSKSLVLSSMRPYWQKQKGYLYELKKIIIPKLEIPDVNRFTSSEDLKKKLEKNPALSSTNACASENLDTSSASVSPGENKSFKRLQIEQTYYSFMHQSSENTQIIDKLDLLLRRIELHEWNVPKWRELLKQNKTLFKEAKKSYCEILPKIDSSNKLSHKEQEAEKQLHWALKQAKETKERLERINCIEDPIRQFTADRQYLEKNAIFEYNEYCTGYYPQKFQTACKDILSSCEDQKEYENPLQEVLKEWQEKIQPIKRKIEQRQQEELEKKRDQEIRALKDQWNDSKNRVKKAKGTFPDWLAELLVPSSWLDNVQKEFKDGVKLVRNGENEDLGKSNAKAAIVKLESKQEELTKITTNFQEIKKLEEYRQFIALNDNMTHGGSFDGLDPHLQTHFQTELLFGRDKWHSALTGPDEGSRQDALTQAKELSTQLKNEWEQRNNRETLPAYSEAVSSQVDPHVPS